MKAINLVLTAAEIIMSAIGVHSGVEKIFKIIRD